MNDRKEQSALPFILTGTVVGGILGGTVGALLADPAKRRSLTEALITLDDRSVQVRPYLQRRLLFYQQLLEEKMKEKSRQMIKKIQQRSAR